MPHILIYRLQSKRRALIAEIRRELKGRAPDMRRLLELRSRKDVVTARLAALQPA
ncbi:hypothetical protein [Phenylobacterium sp. J367]|uniref:hypothetical protein n=1 Tax=Phenylobacterium sp. J367 TaxID=2898435 RepID=UPI002151A270|nr:hypothetical protein [Phenylobacterium sp. J367]MCR5878846.1 hypothetical protein [Phenylobacterium sp. J367]